MENTRRVRVNILICVIILVGFAAVGLTGSVTYSEIIRDDIANISRLTATNIYAEIRNELTKPIFVSLTMANDSFLKGWLRAEAAGDNSAEHLMDLQEYLRGIKEKYGYDSVFMVSEATKAYYHYQGINKVIKPDNDHDKWYWNFLHKHAAYDLDVDTDEVNHNRLSVFVNCRVTDESGKLLGVTGVGLEINQVQDLLKHFEQNFQLEAMLFNRDGQVQVHSNSRSIGNGNLLEQEVLVANREEILEDRNSLHVYKYQNEEADGYLITRYVEDLDWYLLVKKDTSVLEQSFRTQMISDFAIYVLAVLLVLLVVNRIILQKERSLVSMAKTDQLTGLPNRRGFNDMLEKADTSEGSLFVFVFDVDNFKKINDQHGHLVGDNILRLYGRLARQAFSGIGEIARWGGDEFAGFLRSGREDTLNAIESFFESIRRTPEFESYHTTISMGVAVASRIDTADTLIYRADMALYEAKGNGKDRYVILDGAHRAPSAD